MTNWLIILGVVTVFYIIQRYFFIKKQMKEYREYKTEFDY